MVTRVAGTLKPRTLIRALRPLLLLLFTLPAFAAERQTLQVAGARLDVVMEGTVDLPRATVLAWVERAARAVGTYYGRFPVPRVRIEIMSFEGGGVGSGTTYPTDGGRIIISLGRQSTEDQLINDWVMTHEMVHLGFPSLPRRHHWMEEGMATYVEPLGRAWAGDLPATKIWADLVDGLPNGLPRDGDRGLDFTPTWGRTYWGGALFFLLADIEIHRRTDNKKGLEHALRGIVAAGGTIDHRWSTDELVAAGDKATGVPVLRELYDRMKGSPAPVDLDDLWKRLGVVAGPKGIVFDARAPLAPVRQGITAGH